MREYRNAITDNARWSDFAVRLDDIFICTPSKCGTTWTQTIVANLLWPDGRLPGQVMMISPWIEAKFIPEAMMHEALRAQTHRRFMKSHTPADAIPWFDEAKYITVGRDGRDAFMSWCNHAARMKMIGPMNEQAAQDGLAALRTFDGDYHGYLRYWLDDHDFFEVLASYWAMRARRNLLFVHYNDLKSDLAGEMRRIAAFLGIAVPETAWPDVVARCTFEAMRDGDQVADMDGMFEGGIKGFLFKGTNGRWRDVLDTDDLAVYQAQVDRLLPPDAAAWMVRGRAAFGGS